MIPSFLKIRTVFYVAILSQLLSFLLLSCTTDVPSSYVEVDTPPTIYPDYIDVTVPHCISTSTTTPQPSISSLDSPLAMNHGRSEARMYARG